MDKSKPNPLCRIYNSNSHCWQPFNTFTLRLANEEGIFHYKNHQSLSSTNIHKKITYDYVAYFSRVIPSILKPQGRTSKQNQEDLAPGKIECILIFEDLTRRYSRPTHEDQYILLGFEVRNLTYDENNVELKFIRDLIANIHFRLKYSKGGIIYQVSQRMNTILYKTVKYALCFLAELFNIHPSLPTLQKLKDLQKMYHDPAFNEYLSQIITNDTFIQELTSLAYKTIIHYGLFPSYVELNTMDEIGIWLKFKDLISNLSTAPYGSNHHASICIGNFRYSYVFEPNDKEKQKVTINLESKRCFSFKNRGFQYFRIKYFDFFPMDSWVADIASAAARTLALYLDKTRFLPSEMLDDGSSLKEFLQDFIRIEHGPEKDHSLSRRLAEEFYGKYHSELNEDMNDKMFKKMTRVITDAELRGYRNLSNNCQTVVASILSVLKQQFHKYVEPLLNIKDMITIKSHDVQDFTEDFLKFGTHFNHKFRHIGPFSLTYKLSYFDTFIDKHTSQLLIPSRFGGVHENAQAYLEKEEIKKFLDKFEKTRLNHAKSYKGEYFKNKSLSMTQSSSSSVNFGSDNNYELVSCLMNVKYNELFNIRRQIKIAKYCKAKLEDHYAVNSRTVGPVSLRVRRSNNPKREEKLLRETVDKLPELYAQKNKLMTLYKELAYYYYNNIRLAIKTKMNNSISWFGCVLIKKPDGDNKDLVRMMDGSSSCADSIELHNREDIILCNKKRHNSP